jgi:hypothetical protein
MPVNVKHSEYLKFEPRWLRCRHCYEGSDAVKEAGVTYLPELDSHKISGGGRAYEAYKARALFFNATGRTVDGFAGAVFQKTPTVKLEPEQEDVMEVEEEPELDENFAPVKDKDGNQVMKPKVGPDGKPVLKKKIGPDGKPLKQQGPEAEEEEQEEEEEKPKGKPKLDEEGNPIPLLDEDGEPVLDEDGKPQFEMEEELDEDGKPVVRDEDGDETEEELDEEGKPALDEEGKPKRKKKVKKAPFAEEDKEEGEDEEEEEEEPELDEKGKPKLGPDGKPLMKKLGKVRTDEFGKPIMGPDGKPMRKAALPKKKENPVKKHVKDITLTGQTLDLFAFEAMQEVLTTGRYGILVDMADTEIREKQRPYWAGYEAETIVNWKTERIDGEEKLIRVVLQEDMEVEDPIDPFGTIKEEQFRVLSLVEGVYTQRVWAKGETLRKHQEEKGLEDSKGTAKVSELKEGTEIAPYSIAAQRAQYNGEPTAMPVPSPDTLKKKGSDDFGVIEEIIPVRRGKPLDFIPFYFVNATGAEACVSKPPLLDLVDLNLSHYRTLADLEHGRHFVALPTPWISGAAVNEQNEIQLGPSGTIILEKGGAAGMLEFSGAGLRALETADEQKRKMMSVLGARLLEEQAMANETASAVGMRHSGEQAVLRTIVQVLEQQLSRALQAHAWWMGTEKEPDDLDFVEVELNKDFFSVRMQPAELAQLLAALQADGISYKTFYHNLAIGGITRPGVDDEEEQRELENKTDSPASAMPTAMVPLPPEGTPNPQPPGAPPPAFAPVNGPKPGPPKGVTPPGLAASAAAAKAGAAKAKGTPFGRTS